MRAPLPGEHDGRWGERHVQVQSDEQRVWLQRIGERGWTLPR